MLCCQGFEVNHTTTSPVDALPMKASNSCMIEIRKRQDLFLEILPLLFIEGGTVWEKSY